MKCIIHIAVYDTTKKMNKITIKSSKIEIPSKYKFKQDTFKLSKKNYSQKVWVIFILCISEDLDFNEPTTWDITCLFQGISHHDYSWHFCIALTRITKRIERYNQEEESWLRPNFLNTVVLNEQIRQVRLTWTWIDLCVITLPLRNLKACSRHAMVNCHSLLLLERQSSTRAHTNRHKRRLSERSERTEFILINATVTGLPLSLASGPISFHPQKARNGSPAAYRASPCTR